MFGIGMSEMVIILAVALLVFGPQKLPEIAKGLAKGLRELRKAGDDLRSSIDLDDDRPHRPRRAPTRPEPALEEGSAHIQGSALSPSGAPAWGAGESAVAPLPTAPAPDATATPADAAPSEPAPAAALRWPQPADGTLAQGSLESELAAEGPRQSGEEPPEAPPGEAKGG